jgi:hypothetical protein
MRRERTIALQAHRLPPLAPSSASLIRAEVMVLGPSLSRQALFYAVLFGAEQDTSRNKLWLVMIKAMRTLSRYGARRQ